MPDTPDGSFPGAATSPSRRAAPDPSTDAELAPPAHLTQKYLDLAGTKFVESIVAAGLAGVYHLAKDVVKGNLKGMELLRALDFLNRQYGLPHLTDYDVRDSTAIQRWADQMEAQGFDVRPWLKSLTQTRRDGTHG